MTANPMPPRISTSGPTPAAPAFAAPAFAAPAFAAPAFAAPVLSLCTGFGTAAPPPDTPLA